MGLGIFTLFLFLNFFIFYYSFNSILNKKYVKSVLSISFLIALWLFLSFIMSGIMYAFSP